LSLPVAAKLSAKKIEALIEEKACRWLFNFTSSFPTS